MKPKNQPIFLETNMCFRPSDVSEDIYDKYTDIEKFSNMEVVNGAMLISGDHVVQSFYESDGMTLLVNAYYGGYRTTEKYKSFKQKLENEGAVFIK